MTNSRKALCLLVAFLMAFAHLALAQGTYTQIDVPGSSYTLAWSIDSAGDIAGWYQDYNTSLLRGFVLRGGTYTTISYPGLDSTEVRGINDFDQVVGSAYSNLAVVRGFSYNLQTQTFTTIKFPGAPTSWPSAINNAGKIAGYFDESGVQRGFELVGSNYHLIVPPGATRTYAWGIDTAGAVVGFAEGSGNYLYNGRYRKLLVGGVSDSEVLGISGAGTAIVGSYTLPDFSQAGFVYQNKTFQELQFPAALDTYAIGINASGEIVGYFYDASYNPHGFLWTPPGDAGKKINRPAEIIPTYDPIRIALYPAVGSMRMEDSADERSP